MTGPEDRAELPMTELIAIAYTDDTLAAQAAEELERCADDLVIDPDAVSVAVCERAGGMQLMTSHRSGATETWARFWAVLFGVLMNDAEKSGIDFNFRQRTKTLMKPGNSLLFAIVEGPDPERARSALSQYGGIALSTPLIKARTPELWGSLGGKHV